MTQARLVRGLVDGDQARGGAHSFSREGFGPGAKQELLGRLRRVRAELLSEGVVGARRVGAEEHDLVLAAGRAEGGDDPGLQVRVRAGPVAGDRRQDVDALRVLVRVGDEVGDLADEDQVEHADELLVGLEDLGDDAHRVDPIPNALLEHAQVLVHLRLVLLVPPHEPLDQPVAQLEDAPRLLEQALGLLGCLRVLGQGGLLRVLLEVVQGAVDLPEHLGHDERPVQVLQQPLGLTVPAHGRAVQGVVDPRGLGLDEVHEVAQKLPHLVRRRPVLGGLPPDPQLVRLGVALEAPQLGRERGEHVLLVRGGEQLELLQVLQQVVPRAVRVHQKRERRLHQRRVVVEAQVEHDVRHFIRRAEGEALGPLVAALDHVLEHVRGLRPVAHLQAVVPDPRRAPALPLLVEGLEGLQEAREAVVLGNPRHVRQDVHDVGHHPELHLGGHVVPDGQLEHLLLLALHRVHDLNHDVGRPDEAGKAQEAQELEELARLGHVPHEVLEQDRGHVQGDAAAVHASVEVPEREKRGRHEAVHHDPAAVPDAYIGGEEDEHYLVQQEEPVRLHVVRGQRELCPHSHGHRPEHDDQDHEHHLDRLGPHQHGPRRREEGAQAAHAGAAAGWLGRLVLAHGGRGARALLVVVC
mmetsp:Transcript_12178/g.28538  ORF Transcript_12178/g.28538 Transcript_12178/m.28538 type:complete len:637 (-) Transcript_12178:406-2316(-)